MKRKTERAGRQIDDHVSRRQRLNAIEEEFSELRGDIFDLSKTDKRNSEGYPEFRFRIWRALDLEDSDPTGSEAAAPPSQ
jgi:hypothetical protein